MNPHGLDGIPSGYTAYWDHATNREIGGVGIIISKKFLADVMGPHGSVRWETAVTEPLLEAGRLARLAIRGPLGALDIYVNYWRAGETSEDRDSRC